MKIKKFEDIRAWNESRVLNKKIFQLAEKLKIKHEYTLAEHIKKTSLSIMANIAEGYSRSNNNDFVRFLFYSKSSCSELKSHLYLIMDFGYIDSSEFDELYQFIENIEKMISKFISYLKQNKRS